MRSLVYFSFTGSVLFIAFLSHFLPSRCLPTTRLSAYVTQLSNGQIQVAVPLTSTPGTTTTSMAPPNQPSRGTFHSSSSTAKTHTNPIETRPSTVTDIKKLDSSAVPLTTLSTKSDEAEPKLVNQTPEHVSKTPVPTPPTSSEAFDVIQTTSRTEKPDTGVPVQGSKRCTIQHCWGPRCSCACFYSSKFGFRVSYTS